jgi:hypothetical protein
MAHPRNSIDGDFMKDVKDFKEWFDACGWYKTDPEFAAQANRVFALAASSVFLKEAIIEIRDKSQLSGVSFETQSFQNTETARRALLIVKQIL